jgi:hypothetical protein
MKSAKVNFILLVSFFVLSLIFSSCGISEEDVKDWEKDKKKPNKAFIKNKQENIKCQNEYDNLVAVVDTIIFISANVTFDDVINTKIKLKAALEKQNECSLNTGSRLINIKQKCLDRAKSSEILFKQTKDEDFKKRMDLYNELAKLIVDVQ